MQQTHYRKILQRFHGHCSLSENTEDVTGAADEGQKCNDHKNENSLAASRRSHGAVLSGFLVIVTRQEQHPDAPSWQTKVLLNLKNGSVCRKTTKDYRQRGTLCDDPIIPPDFTTPLKNLGAAYLQSKSKHHLHLLHHPTQGQAFSKRPEEGPPPLLRRTQCEGVCWWLVKWRPCIVSRFWFTCWPVAGYSFRYHGKSERIDGQTIGQSPWEGDNLSSMPSRRRARGGHSSSSCRFSVH